MTATKAAPAKAISTGATTISNMARKSPAASKANCKPSAFAVRPAHKIGALKADSDLELEALGLALGSRKAELMAGAGR